MPQYESNKTLSLKKADSDVAEKAMQETKQENEAPADPSPADLHAQLAKAQEELAMLKAKNHPVISSKTLDPVDDSELGRGQDRFMSSTGDASDSLQEPRMIAQVDSPLGALDQEKLANLAFLREKITIHVHDTSDPNAEQAFEININGRPQMFKRGEQWTGPRYYVDHILRMKGARIKQKEVVDSDGVRGYVHTEIPYLVYPVSLVHDANPMGRSWFDYTQKAL